MDSFYRFVNQGQATHDFRIVRERKKSSGSKDTVNQINSNLADLGIIQANTRERATNVSSIAHIFSEVFFLLSLKPVSSPYELQRVSGRKPLLVSTLPKGSQPYEDLKSLMSFYKYTINEDYSIIEGDYEQGLQRLFRGEVHYAFFISGLGNNNLRKALENCGEKIHLVPLENRKAFAFLNPDYTEYTIPDGIFGRQFSEYKSLATRATLVCRSQLNDLSFAVHFEQQLFRETS